MADNYLERKYEEYQLRKQKEEKARRIAWKKRLEAYKQKIASASSSDINSTPTTPS